MAFSAGFENTRTCPNNHYFSIQANPLIRQLLNFGGSSQNLSNPFLINYSFNGKRSGVGMNFGWGLELDNFIDGDQFNERETKIRELFFRVGIDKKFDLHDRWQMGWGVDLIREDVKNHTVNTFDGGGGNEKVETTTSSKGWGFGPRLSLAFRLNNKLLLGTEVSYYYTHRTIKSKVEQDVNEDEEESTTNTIDLLLPTVILIYLTFAF